jgi:hypothetical protein
MILEVFRWVNFKGVNVMHSRRAVFFAVTIALLSMPGYAQQSVSGTPRQLPQPFETIKDSKQFNAVRLGPGNMMTVVETPPDFRLTEFAITPDGRLLAMGWGSGRIELWNLRTKRRISEFNSGLGATGVLQFNSAGGQLVVTGSGGKIAIFDVSTSKKLRQWTIPLGKYHYDIQEVVLDPQGKWLAYADEESSKVLDLMADPPRPLADLKDAYSLALSRNGSELWTVNNTNLTRFNTANWQETGHWSLKSAPVAASSPVIRTGLTADGERSVAVPSSKGLVIYREPEMLGEYVTDKSTSAVAFAGGSNTFVDVARDLTFLNAAGKVLCKRSYRGRYGYAVSEDGQWFALRQFSSVDLWRMEDLLRDCSVAP